MHGLLLTATVLLAALTAGAADFDAATLDRHVSELRFPNAGTVTRDAVFRPITRDCFYVETEFEYFRRTNYPYLYALEDGRWVDPPLGVRSAVPLGGLGAGSVELRADGRFVDWNVFNNTPSSNDPDRQLQKVQLDDAVLGLWVRKDGRRYAKVLRTHAPYGLPSVQRIDYAGAFPLSRLRVTDPALPLEATVYAYGEFQPRRPERSATPCVLLSLRLHNPADVPVDAGVLFNLPNHIRGRFRADAGLHLLREGTDPVAGDMTLTARGADTLTCTAADELRTVWIRFVRQGRFDPDTVAAEAAQAALAATLRLEPGQTRVVTLALSWYFPHRRFYGDEIGNYYTTLFDDSRDVARTALDRLDETWQQIVTWNRACCDNSLPVWLQDALVNSAATMVKTSLWARDGRYRQYESFSCWDIDAIHIHFARSLPYELFFPSLKENLFQLYARSQRDDGYIYEQYGHKQRNTPFDHAFGRTNGDTCTTFVLGVYLSHRWRGSAGLTTTLWPHVKRAIQWQMERSEQFGLPHNLVSTYDLSGFHTKHLVTYNAFMHLAALRAAEELARAQGDDAFARRCHEFLTRGRAALMEHLWTGDYFRCWWNQDRPAENLLHVDSLYGQLWAHLLGLGDLAPPEALRSHLAAEQRYADSPYGLQVIVDPGRPRSGAPDVAAFLEPGTLEAQDRYNGRYINQTVWQVGSIDWTTLNLQLGQEVPASLRQAEKLINHWRQTLRDPWDYRDLTAVWDGHPYCNSHYGRQLMFWAIPLALVGQDYDAAAGRLSLAPRPAPPYRLPLFTPQASGVLQADAQGTLTLEVLDGRLVLRELVVGGRRVAGPVDQGAGTSLSLGEARP